MERHARDLVIGWCQLLEAKAGTNSLLDEGFQLPEKKRKEENYIDGCRALPEPQGQHHLKNVTGALSWLNPA